MKTFVKLNKNEMKMILGGVDQTIGGIDDCTGDCTTDSDCTKEGETCIAFRPSCSTLPIGFCGVKQA